MTKAAQHPRDYLAKKWLQLRIALAYLAVIAAGSALTIALLLPRLLRVLKAEMYRGHSTVTNTSEIVREDVLVVNLVVTAVVLLASAGIALAILTSVHRAARRLSHDVRTALAGGDPSAWEPLRGPREFRHLQRLIASGIRGHRAHLAEIDVLCAALLEQVRAAQGDTAGCRDLRSLHVLCERLRSHARRIHAE